LGSTPIEVSSNLPSPLWSREPSPVSFKPCPV
jgi:hypothetical protein